MKIIKKEHVFNIYANSTKIYANSTIYFANIEKLSLINGVKFFPRKNGDDLTITIVDELTGEMNIEDAFMINRGTHFELEFIINFEITELQRYYVELHDGLGECIYKGQLLITEQDTQKLNYHNE